MRRKDREITDISEIESILNNCKVVHIALNAGDFPYVLAMHFGFELKDGVLTLYMHSAKEGRKLDLIAEDPKAAFIADIEGPVVSGGDVPCKYGAEFASVMGTGHIESLSGAEEKIKGLKIIMKAQTGRDFDFNAEMADSVCVLKLSCSDFTAKARK